MDKHEALEKLLSAYSHSYDIFRDVEVEGGRYPAAAFFYLRDEHYLVRRDKQFYATEQHDYTYFYLTDRLDEIGRASCRERVCQYV